MDDGSRGQVLQQGCLLGCGRAGQWLLQQGAAEQRDQPRFQPCMPTPEVCLPLHQTRMTSQPSTPHLQGAAHALERARGDDALGCAANAHHDVHGATRLGHLNGTTHVTITAGEMMFLGLLGV